MVPVGMWVGGSFGKSSHFVAQLARITCKNSSRVEFHVWPSVAIRTIYSELKVVILEFDTGDPSFIIVLSACLFRFLRGFVDITIVWQYCGALQNIIANL